MTDGGARMTQANHSDAFREWVENRRKRVEQELDKCLPSAQETPRQLHEAMRYSVLGGGKRIRPLLTYATGEALGVPEQRLDPPACAVELIHCYSLVHDDLPAMDDDELRRGRPTTHKKFGEATAILTGDALQALAFQVLAYGEDPAGSSRWQTRATRVLGRACGSKGMAGGQALDLAAENTNLDLPALEQIHALKTGELIRAAVLMACCCRDDLPDAEFQQFDRFARLVGLAFQVKDDILDVVAETSTLGKTQGADAARNKVTYVSMYGVEGATRKATELFQAAMDCLEPYDATAQPLRELCNYVVNREY